jgi:hypothetical protein
MLNIFADGFLGPLPAVSNGIRGLLGLRQFIYSLDGLNVVLEPVSVKKL